MLCYFEAPAFKELPEHLLKLFNSFGFPAIFESIDSLDISNIALFKATTTIRRWRCELDVTYFMVEILRNEIIEIVKKFL